MARRESHQKIAAPLPRTASRIALFGAGFVGTPLGSALEAQGHTVIRFGRDRFDALRDEPPDLSGFDVVINLIGTPIAPPWTAKKLRSMRDSRVLSARKLSAAARDAQAFYMQSSGVGSSGFLGALREEWESSVIAERAAICRFGLVIGDGGLLRSLEPLFRSGFGGVFGRGDQTYAWIPLEVLTDELVTIVAERRCGTFELAREISARDFYRGIAKGLGRPCRFRYPAWALRIMMPRSHELLTASTPLNVELAFDERIEAVVRATVLLR
jgi:NAD dependent epimerase/dehydratase family enzyme